MISPAQKYLKRLALFSYLALLNPSVQSMILQTVTQTLTWVNNLSEINGATVPAQYYSYMKMLADHKSFFCMNDQYIINIC